MNPRQTPFLLGLAAAALLLRGVATPASSPPAAGSATSSLAATAATGGDAAALSPTPSPPGAAPVQGAEDAWRQYARLYREVLAVPPSPPPAASGETRRVRGRLMAQPVSLDISVQPTPAPVTGDDLSAIARHAKDCRLESMIALVADPIDSRLAVDFDLALIALQRGLAEAKYQLIRKWLPWTDPDEAEQKQHRGAAGMMLFRYSPGPGDPTKPSLLAVFVVGETPKLGIHKLAFERAVDFILALHQAAGGTSPSRLEIPVLGPTFSGSADSLNLAMAAAKPVASFKIVSGSAAAADVEARLRAGALAARVSFTRTLVEETALARTALLFLQDKMGWDLDRAALLIEYDTVYGGELLESSIIPRLTTPLLKLSFPSGLFELRNAWEEAGYAPPPQDLAANPKAQSGSKTTLDVSLKDQGTPIDVVPELSPLTSRIGDMAASNLLRELSSSRSRISYVGILATDIKDELFLAEQIRRWAPGVILFLFDNNLLYIHPQYNATMFGTLAISSFPLAPEGAVRAQSLTTPVDRRRQFASALQEGTFLAVRCLLGRQVPAPDVWIAAAGNHAMSPLARLPAGSPPPRCDWFPATLGPQARPDPSQQAAAATRPSSKSGLQPLLLILVLCGASYALRRAAFFGWKAQPSAPTSAQRRARLLLCVGTTLLLLAAVGILSLAWLLRAWPVSLLQPERTPWAWLLVLAEGAVFLNLAWDLVLATSLYDGARRARRFVLALGCLLLPLLTGWLTFLLWQVDDDGFFRLRARAFSGGLSPLVSLAWLLAAVLFWVFIELKRQLVRERHRTSWPFHDRCGPPFAGSGPDAATLDGILDGTLLPGAWRFVPLALVAPPVLAIWSRIQPIGERRGYGLIFLVIWAVASALGLESFIRFLRAWHQVQRLLGYVEQADLLAAVRDVGAKVGWRPMAFDWYAPSLSALKQEVGQLEQTRSPATVEGDCSPGPAKLFADIQRTAKRRKCFVGEVGRRQQLNACFEQADERLAGHTLVAEYYAARLIAYLRQILNQLRYSVIAALGTGLAAILGVVAYAFEPRQLLMLCVATILLGVSAATVVVFVQMERNATLSAIGGTEPGKVTFDWAFYSKLLTYVALPALALVAGQFPALGRLLTGVLDPLARLLGAG
jgi:hypothetical protein